MGRLPSQWGRESDDSEKETETDRPSTGAYLDFQMKDRESFSMRVRPMNYSAHQLLSKFSADFDGLVSGLDQIQDFSPTNKTESRSINKGTLTLRKDPEIVGGLAYLGKEQQQSWKGEHKVDQTRFDNN